MKFTVVVSVSPRSATMPAILQEEDEGRRSPLQAVIGRRYREWLAEIGAAMEGRDERVASIKNLIAAFVDKLTKNKKRFDTKLLHTMLTELRKQTKFESLGDIQAFVDKMEQKRAKSGKKSNRKSPTPSVMSAPSIGVTSASSRRTSIVQRPETIMTSGDAVENLYQYFNWFLDYLQYLRELKNNFDQRIFYPMFHLHQSEAASVDHASREDNEQLRETLYKSRKILSSLGEDFRDLLDLCDDEESGNTMNGLLYLGGRWESLLADKNSIDKEYFSLESAALVESFKCDENIRIILRVIPDIFVKGMKANVLVNQWLTLNERRHMSLNERLAKIKKIRNGLSKRSRILLEKIEAQEKLLAKETAELDTMLKREDRWDILRARLDDVDEKIIRLKADLRHMEEEKDSMAKALVASARKDTDEFDSLKVEFEENQLRYKLLQQRLGVQLYKRSIIQSDLEVELDVKPSLLRHTDHVQDRCEVIEREIDLAKTERQSLEKLLGPLREEETKLKQKISAQNSPSSSLPEKT